MGDLRLCRLKEVMERTGLSRSTIYGWMKEGRFPSSVELGQRSVAWRSDDLDQWIRSRIQECPK